MLRLRITDSAQGNLFTLKVFQQRSSVIPVRSIPLSMPCLYMLEHDSGIQRTQWLKARHRHNSGVLITQGELLPVGATKHGLNNQKRKKMGAGEREERNNS